MDPIWILICAQKLGLAVLSQKLNMFQSEPFECGGAMHKGRFSELRYHTLEPGSSCHFFSRFFVGPNLFSSLKNNFSFWKNVIFEAPATLLELLVLFGALTRF